MGKRGDVVSDLKWRHNAHVIARDKGRCIICQSLGVRQTANHVHEILSKSKFATRDIPKCITPENMISVCAAHHAIVQGIPAYNGHLLRILSDLYGYSYDEPFIWYVENEWPTSKQLERLALKQR